VAPDRFGAYRRHAPVHWHSPSKAWLITRYDDVRHLLTDERLTSATLGGRIGELNGLTADERGKLSAFFDGWLSLADGDHHRELRRLIAPVLAPSRIEPWAAYFAELATEQAKAAYPQQFELSFARPYAAAVVGRLLGLRAPETGPALRATAQLVRVLGGGPVTPDDARTAAAALAEVTALTREVVTRPPPAGRPASLLCGAGVPARLQTPVFVQFAAGGYEPLARCITAYASVPLTDPGAAGPVITHPVPVGDASAAGDWMLEEIIRLYGPFELLPRVARCPVELHGQTVSAGSRALLAIGSANRDEARFPAPLELRPDRVAMHLAFGDGRHRCPASVLARAALRAAWRSVRTMSQVQKPRTEEPL
jgi:cytochrome P450